MEEELEAKIYELFRAWVKRGEAERHWDVFDDIPWTERPAATSERLRSAVSTLLLLESFLPFFVEPCLSVVSKSPAVSLFLMTWSNAKARHVVALREWLRYVGHVPPRGRPSARWELPFESIRQMVFYGAVQEMATFVTYTKHRDLAHSESDTSLRTLFGFIARDEIAHCRFLEGVTRLMIEEDREGSVADMAFVLSRFVTPGRVLLQDYEDQTIPIREAGLDRGVFIQRVYIPILKQLGVSRSELAKGRAPLTRRRRRVMMIESTVGES